MALRISKNVISRILKLQRGMTSRASDEAYRKLRWVDPKENPISSPNRFFRPGPNQEEGYLSVDFIVKMQKKIDFSPQSIKRWIDRTVLQRKLAFQRAVSQRRMMYGVEIGAATFVVQLNGSVRFKNQTNWIKIDENTKKKVLPMMPVRGTNLEGADLTNTEIMYEGLDNLIGLRNLQSLNLNGCSNIDDWCLDKISCRMRENLRCLDLSNCPNVTERGLLVLPRLRNLTSLYLHNLPRVNFAPLVCILLEDAMPKCKIYGIDYMEGASKSEEISSTDDPVSATS